MSKELKEQQVNATEAIKSFKYISGKIDNIIPLMKGLNGDFEEIHREENEVYSSLEKISSFSEEITATTEEVAASSDEIASIGKVVETISSELDLLVDTLNEGMSKFTLNNE